MNDVAQFARDVRRRAEAGDPAATIQLALDLLTSGGGPTAAQEGALWAERAADDGSLEALRLSATLAAAGIGQAQDWPLAFERLARAAALGSPDAQGQLQVLALSDDRDWDRLAGAIDVATWLAPPAKRSLCEAPRLRVMERFLPLRACAWLMDRALPRLLPVTLFNPITRRDEPHPARTGRVAMLDLQLADVVTAMVRARISAAVKLPLPCFEPTQLLHYAEGQTFAPHCDFLDGRTLVNFDDGRPYEGQRIATFLVYLNDDYAGGETDFPRARLRFQGRQGDALYFANVDPDARPDPLTLHQGLPPRAGAKWLLSQWIHDRTFTAVSA